MSTAEDIGDVACPGVRRAVSGPSPVLSSENAARLDLWTGCDKRFLFIGTFKTA